MKLTEVSAYRLKSRVTKILRSRVVKSETLRLCEPVYLDEIRCTMLLKLGPMGSFILTAKRRLTTPRLIIGGASSPFLDSSAKYRSAILTAR